VPRVGESRTVAPRYAMSKQLIDTLLHIPDLDVETDVPMSAHTSFGIGGPADALVTPKTSEALAQVMKVLFRAGERPLVIGKGTNMLVLDGGIRETVVKLAGGLDHIEVDGDRIVADSGVRLASLCRACADNGLTGMEWSAGIPGTLGGALHMNAGANGGEIGQFTEWVTIVTLDGELQTLRRDEIGFSYRSSSFQEMDCIIARAGLRLEEATQSEVHEKICGVIESRCQKQPVAMPSAGCVFKRPTNDYAGRLLDEAGAKGMRVGGAVVSHKHANFIVNDGDATAQDVLELIGLVRGKVKDLFGVELATEVCVVGEPLDTAASVEASLVSEAVR